MSATRPVGTRLRTLIIALTAAAAAVTASVGSATVATAASPQPPAVSPKADLMPAEKLSAAAFAASPATDTGATIAVAVPSSLRVDSAVEVRQQTDGSGYRGRVIVAASGAVSVGLSRISAGTEVSLGSTPVPLMATADQSLVLEVQAVGDSPVELQARVWLEGGSIPDWQLTVTDGGASHIAGAGGVGTWNYLTGSASLSTTSNGVEVASLSASIAAPKALTYRSATFDAMPIGQIVPSDFERYLGGTYSSAPAYDDMTVVPDGRGGQALRTRLAAGTILSTNGADNGANLFLPLPSAVDTACISYDLRFDTTFDWSMGGKLPGLEGVAPGVDPSAPTGGKSTDLGWSGRMMWLGPKAYSWAGPLNGAVSYLYHPGQLGTYGDNEVWNRAFVAGFWHRIKVCYTMNTVGKANGVLQAWMDGSMVLNNQSYVYRTSSTVHITHLIFSIFRGGGTLDWASTRDGYVDIDNLQVTSK